MTGYTVFFALLMALGTGQMPYTSPELGFTVMVPAGFLPEGGDPLNTRAVACFITPAETASSTWARLCIERLGGGLPRGARQMTFAWKGLDLRGASFDSQWNDADVAVFAALVPLRKESLWLVAMAPPADRAYAEAALVSTLATLQGEGATLSSAERAERAERAGSQVGFVAGIIMAIGVGMWLQQRRQQQRS